ncbi:MAG: hypothetical protein OJF49_002074 [Ktedonobacterales bacterium]|nr:MAG: hypothetical protein OJF49_002074 [Ktedonobacterales bacterium]
MGGWKLAILLLTRLVSRRLPAMPRAIAGEQGGILPVLTMSISIIV